MRAINYIKNRFEFALNNTGTIKVNEKDIEALNSLIEYTNTHQQNEQLEDALLLFWIFNYWQIEIENRKAVLKEKDKSFLQLTSSRNILDKLCGFIKPKNELIKEITIQLQSAQMEYGISKENLIPESEVSEMMSKLLRETKSNFTPISDLKKYWKVEYQYPEATEAQKAMMSNSKLINPKSSDSIINTLKNHLSPGILNEVRTAINNDEK